MRNAIRMGLVVLVVAVVGCGDSSSEGGPDLSSHWPNQDSTSWRYAAETSDAPFSDLSEYTFPIDSLPPLPTFDEVVAFLDSLPPLEEERSHDWGTLTLAFSGMGSTLSGVQGQKLTADAVVDSSLAPPAGTRFLRSLWQARPDLRPQLDGILPAAQAANELEPILIHGGIFEKTPDWIGAWGDVDTLLAWKYLESDLSPGATFRHQLVPSLVEDVFLHARIEGRSKRETAVGALNDVLRVTYLVDYGQGITPAEDEGVIRYVLMGRVDYAPGLGPVTVLERDLVPLGGEAHPGFADRRLDVLEVSFPD